MRAYMLPWGSRCYAGHSHWHNIRHIKSRRDKERASSIDRHVLSIISAVRSGGGDESKNALLSAALRRANKSNIPKDRIKGAVAKGLGEGVGGRLDEVTYEISVRGGLFVVVETLTDNRNRTPQLLRTVLANYGGSIQKAGSVVRLFERRGEIWAPFVAPQPPAAQDTISDRLMEVLLDLDVDDFSVETTGFRLLCPPRTIASVRDKVAHSCADLIDINSIEVDVETVPSPDTPLVPVGVFDGSDTPSFESLIDELEELPDVKAVYHTLSRSQ